MELSLKKAMCLSLKSNVFSSEYMNYNKNLFLEKKPEVFICVYIYNPKQDNSNRDLQRFPDTIFIVMMILINDCYNAYDDVDNNNYYSKKTPQKPATIMIAGDKEVSR